MVRSMTGETTFLLGNGIGRAIDNNYFSLKTGIQSSLCKLQSAEKDVIDQLFKSNYSEEALETHHSIANSCQSLIDLETKHSLSYLKDSGKNFPNSLYNFIYLTAKYFWDYPIDKCPKEFNEFVNRFSNYIRKKKSNVANLNYDKLIYSSFVDNNILKRGYDGVLIDGILNKSGIFEAENFLDKNRNNCGYYLHLHGSPSIYLENTNVKKTHHRDTLPNCFAQENSGKIHNTIVLSHANLKSDIIFTNRVLATYFTAFQFALSDSNALCIIGYGGEDNHINNAIKKWVYDKVINDAYNIHIYIVNYADSSDITAESWTKKFYPEFKYEQRSVKDHVELHYQKMANILEFDFQIDG